jgi:hypothetical protein
VTGLKPPFDIILLSDVLYVEALNEPLAQTILALSAPWTSVLMSNEKRSERLEGAFYRRMVEHWILGSVPQEQLHRRYRDESIRVFHMHRRDRPTNGTADRSLSKT